MITRWRIESIRIVAMCGNLDVGAIFPGIGRRTRWRAWVTKNANPVEGTARDDQEAKAEVEKRFGEFLALSGLWAVAPVLDGAPRVGVLFGDGSIGVESPDLPMAQQMRNARVERDAWNDGLGDKAAPAKVALFALSIAEELPDGP